VLSIEVVLASILLADVVRVEAGLLKDSYLCAARGGRNVRQPNQLGVRQLIVVAQATPECE
jgi:hypothetical protein